MTYLPAFKRCVQAGSYSLMCSFNRYICIWISYSNTLFTFLPKTIIQSIAIFIKHRNVNFVSLCSRIGTHDMKLCAHIIPLLLKSIRGFVTIPYFKLFKFIFKALHAYKSHLPMSSYQDYTCAYIHIHMLLLNQRRQWPI